MGVRAELLSKAEHAELLEEMSHMASELIKIAERERSGISDGDTGWYGSSLPWKKSQESWWGYARPAGGR